MKLIKYDQACKALAIAKRVDEAKQIRDVSEAMRAYAHQAGNKDLEADAFEIRSRAERRMYELNEKRIKNRGTRGQLKGRSSSGGLKFNPPEDLPTLPQLGVDKNMAHRMRQMGRFSDEKFEAMIQHAREKIIEDGNRLTTGFLRQIQDDEKKAELYREIHIQTEGIIVGDFRELSNEIPDSSVELIFTDPPYDRDSLPLYEAAAEVGARILKPGGSFISYTGQILLYEVHAVLSRHLRYWWTNCCLHGGAKNRMTEYGVVNGWKPMLWFVKDYRGDKMTFVDDVVTGEREKSHHEWQQSELEADYYIPRLTVPGGLVVDFFCGGGTTCVVACQHDRPFVAFEIDPETAAIADRRLQAL